MTRLAIPRQTTDCYSEHPGERDKLARLFDSTDLFDHNEAARLCHTCPFVNACGQLAADIAQSSRWAGAPSGTWGGVLWRAGKPVQRRRRSA